MFADLAPIDVTVHALISRADLSAEAKTLSLQYGSDLAPMLAQVKIAGGIFCACTVGTNLHAEAIVHAGKEQS